MHAKLRLTPVLLLVVACGSSDDAAIQAGDDISGDYRGCVNDACTELTPAGFRFTTDGKVVLLQGSSPADWPDECSDPTSETECSYNDWTLCPEEVGLFDGVSWQWNNAGELVLSDIAAVGDVVLETKGALIEVPAHESEPGTVYVHITDYPDAEWMKRVAGANEGCLEPR